MMILNSNLKQAAVKKATGINVHFGELMIKILKKEWKKEVK